MNTRVSGNRLRISSLFVFLLIGMFALLSLLSVVIGVGVYRGVVDEGGNNEQVRTALSYIANKVHATDAQGAVEVSDWHGIETLLLRETIDGLPYETRIYYLDSSEGRTGGLYEHFAYQGQDWGPDGGDLIMSLEHFSMQEEQGGLRLTVTTERGETLSMRLRPQTGL